MQTKTIARLDTISFFVLITSFLAAVVAFVPGFPLAIPIVKGYVFSLGIAVSLFLFVIARLYEGHITFPRSRIALAALGVAALTVLAAFFSPSFITSFWGRGFEIDTAAYVCTMFFAFFLAVHYFVERRRLVLFSTFLLALSSLIGLFTLLRIVTQGRALSLGVFETVLSTPIGSWSETMLFFASSAFLSLAFLDLVRVRKGMLRYVAIATLVLSLIILVLGNFLPAWILLGAFSLLLFVYIVSYENVSQGAFRMVPVFALITLLLSVLLIAGHATIATIPGSYFNISFNEIKPSFSSTLSVGYHTIAHNPLFGAGPSRFSNAWMLSRPQVIGAGAFSDVSFPTGASAVATTLATTGMLGFIAWLVFVAFSIIAVVRTVFTGEADKTARSFKALPAFVFLFFVFQSLFFTPGIVNTIELWLFGGILVALVLREKEKPFYSWHYMNDPRRNFFSMLGILAVLILIVSFGYVRSEQAIGRAQLTKAIIHYGDGVTPTSRTEALLMRSIAFSKRDDTLRTASLFYRREFATTIKNLGGTAPDETKSALLSALWQNTEKYALDAVALNKSDYTNWLFLAGTYTDGALVGIEGSSENAIASYEQAQTLAPTDMAIPLSEAELAAYAKDYDSARVYVNDALALDPGNETALSYMKALESLSTNAATPLPVEVAPDPIEEDVTLEE